MSEKNTILIADDKEVNRECLTRLLEDDYNILQASDGYEALEILDKEKEKISAVVLDIIMPGLDGYGVLNEMAYRKMLPKIPVIVTSVDGDEQSELKALSLGASDFLGKPYNPIIVKKRLQNIIHLKETASLVNYLQMDTLTGVYSKETFSNTPGQVRFFTSRTRLPMLTFRCGYRSPISLPIIILTTSFMSVSEIFFVSI